MRLYSTLYFTRPISLYASNLTLRIQSHFLIHYFTSPNETLRIQYQFTRPIEISRVQYQFARPIRKCYLEYILK